MNSITSKSLDIKNTISKTLTDNPNLKIYTIIVTPIIIFLIYLLYKYSFTTRNNNIVKSISYASQLQLKQLPSCIDIEPKFRYKLCDYYVSSSYMTPCIGNQHYDYVSIDMIQKVLQSGARYIQLPICSETPDYQANPVVATAVYGTQVITSLNTLNIKDVLKAIKAYAFYTDPTEYNTESSDIRYPLIIHFILNTTNTYTLNLLSSAIKSVLLDVLLPNNKYQNFPIWLEQVCNLLNKIILIATPEYKDSNLKEIIIPTDKLFQTLYFNDINNFNVAYTSITTPITTSLNQRQHSYNKLLSENSQRNNNKIFNSKYPSLQYIIDNSDTIGSTILQDTEILNNISSFNKVGMTIVTPMNPTDVLSTNFDPSNAFMNGCQFVSMNFQNNDDNISSYINIFKESSFRLKPDSLRFSETEQPIQNLKYVYSSAKTVDYQLHNTFTSRYINKFISIESYTLPNSYITASQNLLAFRSPNRITIPQITSTLLSSSIVTSIDITQCFRVNKSSLSGNEICVNLESAQYPNQYITVNNDSVILQPLSSISSTLRLQSFYPCMSKTNDTDIEKTLVSFRNIDNTNPLWLCFRSKSLVALSDNNSQDSHNNMTFMVNSIPFNYLIKILTVNGGSVMSTSGVVGILANNNQSTTTYIVKPINNTNFEDIRNNIQVNIQNHDTKTYWNYRNNVLMDDIQSPNTNSIFILQPSQNFYTISNTQGQLLSIINNINLQFVTGDDTTNQFNTLFKIELSYEKL